MNGHVRGSRREHESRGRDSYQASGVWDCRDDPACVNYGDDLLPKVAVFAENIDRLWREREGARVEALGYMVQPVNDEVPMGSIESYPVEIRREVMARRVIVGDRIDRYNDDPAFREWVNTSTDRLIAGADEGPEGVTDRLPRVYYDGRISSICQSCGSGLKPTRQGLDDVTVWGCDEHGDVFVQLPVSP